MQADLDYNSSIPLYAQIVTKLQQDIESGMFSKTGRLPTEGELADQYQVSRITIRRAVDELVLQKLVEKNREKVHFSAPQKWYAE